MVDFKMAYNHYFAQEEGLTARATPAVRRAGWLLRLACAPASMNIQRLLHAADRLSTWAGKAFAWLIVALMLVVCAEVFKRYALNAPTAWIYDANNMMYGTLFMMCGAYTLAQDGHVRGDFLYGSMKPRTQACARPGAVHRCSSCPASAR